MRLFCAVRSALDLFRASAKSDAIGRPVRPFSVNSMSDGIFGLMKLWGLEPDEVLQPRAEGPSDEEVPVFLRERFDR